MARAPKRTLRDRFAILAAELALDGRRWAGIADAAAVAVALGIYFVAFSHGKTIRGANWGFGPEWDCGNPIKSSDLVCIEKPSAKPE